VLEPTCGEAAFLVPIVAALRRRGATDAQIGRGIRGFDVEPRSVAEAQAALARLGIDGDLSVANLFEVDPPGRPGSSFPWMDAVVGNPPFIRYQRFGGRERALAQRAALSAQVRVELSGLASSWAASLVHASEFLAPDGRLAMVLPAELLTVNYAEPIRRFLQRRFASVDLILFEERVFQSALADVVLLLAEGTGRCDHFRLRHVRDEASLEGALTAPMRMASVRSGEKWTSSFLLDEGTHALYLRTSAQGFAPLSAYGTPRLGMVTGANRFFALRPSTVNEHGLCDADLLRISPPGTRHLRGLAFTARDWQNLADGDEPVHLLNLRQPIATGHPAAEMVRIGERSGVSDAYKCRIRRPWYVLPQAEIPDLFFTYMSHRFPRLIENRARVAYLNSMHGIRLEEHVRLAKCCLAPASFNSLTLLGAELTGRSYGGGVLKLEPREAGVLPVPGPDALEEAWRTIRTRKARLEGRFRQADWESVLTEIDEAVLVGALGMARDEVSALRTAAAELRLRRLRKGHGG